MTIDASSLHCPNCGAPASPGDQSCKYCHAALATVACPSCFSVMFEGSAYCPHCGARRSRTAVAGARTVRCPSCKGVMREEQIGDTALMECDGCRGMWIDTATFDRICADREARTAVLQQWTSPARTPAAAEEIHYRPCVACGKMMNRMNFGRVSGTIVDVCKGHGTFLDAGELHLIVSFIQRGGLDRARQRQLDDLKEEEAHLREMQSRADGHPDVRFEMTARSWTGADLLTLLERLKKG
jgi:Zn-finger nucleic acid-binding protein